MNAVFIHRCQDCQDLYEFNIDLDLIARIESYSLKERLDGTDIYCTCTSCNEIDKYTFTYINSQFDIYPDEKTKELYILKENNEQYSTEYWSSSSQYKIFLSTICDIDKLLKSITYNNLETKTLRQLIFTQIITSFETYAADKLKTILFENKEIYFPKLFLADKNIGDKKITISDLFHNPSTLNQSVNEYLSSILYHNISRVNFLFRNIFGVEFEFDSNSEKENFYKSIEKRHDFVHRNGVDQENNTVNCDKEYIYLIMNIAIKIVSNFENSINNEMESRKKMELESKRLELQLYYDSLSEEF